MNYEEFAVQFMKELEEKMGKNVTLERGESIKVNETRDAVIIKNPGTNTSPVIYLDDAYRMYQDGASVAEVIEQITENIDDAWMNINLSDINADYAEKNLYCVVVNADMNKDLMEHYVYEPMEDLAIMARLSMGKNASMAVTDEMCSHLLHMTSSEVMEAARINTEHQEFRCVSMNELIKELLRQNGIAEEYTDEFHSSQQEPYVLSNYSGIDGAVAIASPKALQMAHDILGEDFYILPSSRHEVIVIAESYARDPKILEKMVQDVNSSEVAVTDRLSDHIYHYDSTRRRVNLVDTHVLSNNETLERTDIIRKQYRYH